MLRELTTTTLAVLMLASTASAAITKATERVERKEEIKGEKLEKLDRNQESMKKMTLQTRVFSVANKIVMAANKAAAEGKCDAECVRLAKSLETVVREKESNGLADTTKPEKTIGDINQLLKDGKSIDVALKEGFEKNGVRKDKLLECAGK